MVYSNVNVVALAKFWTRQEERYLTTAAHWQSLSTLYTGQQAAAACAAHEDLLIKARGAGRLADHYLSMWPADDSQDNVETVSPEWLEKVA